MILIGDWKYHLLNIGFNLLKIPALLLALLDSLSVEHTFRVLRSMFVLECAYLESENILNVLLTLFVREDIPY